MCSDQDFRLHVDLRRTVWGPIAGVGKESIVSSFQEIQVTETYRNPPFLWDIYPGKNNESMNLTLFSRPPVNFKNQARYSLQEDISSFRKSNKAWYFDWCRWCTYCWWKKSCTGAGMFDNTVWLLPPHPLFNVVFSSLVRRCRISVIQLLCFWDIFSYQC